MLLDTLFTIWYHLKHNQETDLGWSKDPGPSVGNFLATAVRPTGWLLAVEVAVVKAVRPTGWLLAVEVAMVKAVSPTVRVFPAKVEVDGLFFGAAFSFGRNMKQERLRLRWT